MDYEHLKKNKNYDKVYEGVAKVLKEQLGIREDDIRLDAMLVDDYGADSLDSVEIIMNIEDEFKLQIDDKDAEKIKTVGDIVNYILERNYS